MKKELKDYIDNKQNILKRVMVKNANVLLARVDALKWVIGEPLEMISINKEVLQNNLYISSLDELYKLDTIKTDLNSFDITSRDIRMIISAHICLDAFLKQYQVSIISHCISTKDSAKLDIEKLQQEKKELDGMLRNGYLIQSALVARFSKMQKDIDNELDIAIFKIEKCVTILDKFDKMVSEVINSEEAWCGLLDLLNKK